MLTLMRNKIMNTNSEMEFIFSILCRSINMLILIVKFTFFFLKCSVLLAIWQWHGEEWRDDVTWIEWNNSFCFMIEQIHLCHCWRGRRYLMEINMVLKLLCSFFLQVFDTNEIESNRLKLWCRYMGRCLEVTDDIRFLVMQNDNYDIIFIFTIHVCHVYTLASYLHPHGNSSITFLCNNMIGLCLVMRSWSFLKHRCTPRIVIPWRVCDGSCFAETTFAFVCLSCLHGLETESMMTPLGLLAIWLPYRQEDNVIPEITFQAGGKKTWREIAFPVIQQEDHLVDWWRHRA